MLLFSSVRALTTAERQSKNALPRLGRALKSLELIAAPSDYDVSVRVVRVLKAMSKEGWCAAISMHVRMPSADGMSSASPECDCPGSS